MSQGRTFLGFVASNGTCYCLILLGKSLLRKNVNTIQLDKRKVRGSCVCVCERGALVFPIILAFETNKNKSKFNFFFYANVFNLLLYRLHLFLMCCVCMFFEVVLNCFLSDFFNERNS